MSRRFAAALAVLALGLLGVRVAADAAPHLHLGLERGLAPHEIARTEVEGGCAPALHWHPARTERRPSCPSCLASASTLARPVAAVEIDGGAPRLAPEPPPYRRPALREPSAPPVGRAPPRISSDSRA